ncbi:quinone oxidoreductase-like protein 1 [Diadema setosum]|uniref:quinone oxidoreductase-like protein 1 n=1 Tax=Diadema setosum TaxID=31175 RepID=UPI003B3AC77E
MKAVYWSLAADGASFNRDLLLISDGSIPEAEGTKVLVRVKACGLTDIDVELLQELGLFQQKLPCGTQISGVVTKVGSAVTRFAVGDDVVGVLPLDTEYAGCAEYCLLEEYNLVSKPPKVSYKAAAACIGEGVKMYTALRYLGHVCGGETVLIMDGARPAGFIGVQLAQEWGSKVITTASSETARMVLESVKPEIAHVVDRSERKRFAILNECLEDTGGLGVDCIIDDGVTMYPNEVEEAGQSPKGDSSRSKRSLPEKHEVISTLGIGGRWVTSQRNLQLDPPDSRLLQLKGASVCFLNDATWTLASHKQGKYLHILRDIMQKLEKGTLRPPETHSLKLDEVSTKLKNLLSSPGYKKIVMEM